MEESLINWIKRPTVMRSIYIISCMVISFALGVATEFSIQNRGNEPVLEIPKKPFPLEYRYKNHISENPADLQPATETIQSLQAINPDSVPSESFVASKTGKTFYPAGCAGINRIKPENRVYFATEKEAEEKGLTRSATCK